MQLTFNPHPYKGDDHVPSHTTRKNIALCLKPHSSVKSMIRDLIKHDFSDYTLIDHDIPCSWMSNFSEFEEEELYKMIVKYKPSLMILDDSFASRVFKDLDDDYRDFQETFKLESLFIIHKKSGNFKSTPYLTLTHPDKVSKSFLKRFLKKKLSLNHVEVVL